MVRRLFDDGDAQYGSSFSVSLDNQTSTIEDEGIVSGDGGDDERRRARLLAEYLIGAGIYETDDPPSLEDALDDLPEDSEE